MTETKNFPLISGNLSVDLVNTEVVRRGQRYDLLVLKKDLHDWLYEIKEENPFWDELCLKIDNNIGEVLVCILEMRAFLRHQFELIVDKQLIPDELIVFLEKKIEAAPFTYKLWNHTLIPVPIGEVENVLQALIAFDALTLIKDNKLIFLKRCSNPDCVLLFIDETGRRKWCSMKICGNRKKVARFQQRKSDTE